jgi:hypothetical protein
LVTILIAVFGVVGARPLHVAEICRLAAVLYLPIGASWALCSRFGYRPIDFPETIVLLTAAHFHFAGFAFPVLASEIARRNSARLTRIAAVTAVATVPVVAAGITITHLGGPREIELVAAWLLTATGVILAVHQLRFAMVKTDFKSVPRQYLSTTLIIVSALSLLFALAWTLVYSGGQYGLWLSVDIPFMTRWHGMVNGFGFALLGLIGWNLRGDER